MAQPQSARRADPALWSPPSPRQAAADPERRRRARHFRLRRRDLLEDVAGGALLAIVLLALTSGLGVLALLEVPLAGILVAAGVITRRRGRRARRSPDPRPSQEHSHRSLSDL
jgi:hypothetical protein